MARLRETAVRKDADGTPERRVMARSLMYLFASGATISLVSLVAAGTGADRFRIATITVAGYVMAALLLAGGGRLPRWSFQVLLAAATMLVEWTIYATGDTTSPYAAFYFSIAIYAFYFFRRAEAVLQTAFIVVAYAALFVFAADATSAPVVRWAITMSALVVAGAMIGLLQDRVVKLAYSVRMDTASGLLNRRGFYETLELEIERARRSATTVSVVVARVDGYEEAADRSRRGAGDELIAALRDTLEHTKRAIDHAGRVAPDQIALIAPDTPARGAYVLAERLRVEGRSALAARGLTLSVGVAAFSDNGTTADAVIHAAERAVAAAEQLGRDRSVIYNPEIASLVLAAENRRREDRGDNVASVLALTDALDIRDAGTAVHSQTVGRYAGAIARELGLSDALVERIRLAGILHDVGKIAVSDAVLRKPGPLSDEEYDQMKKHPEVGALIVDGADLKDVAAWVMAHHERPDGRGYPRGLHDDEIPLEARILSVCDAYEAMTCDRVYRRAMSAEAAGAELRRCAGTQFDPRVVDVLLTVLGRNEPGLRALSSYRPPPASPSPHAAAPPSEAPPGRPVGAGDVRGSA